MSKPYLTPVVVLALSIVAASAASRLTTLTAVAASAPEVLVLSNRADLISGGDAVFAFDSMNRLYRSRTAAERADNCGAPPYPVILNGGA